MSIEQQINILEQTDEQYQPFVQELREYVDEFQIEKIKIFMENYVIMVEN